MALASSAGHRLTSVVYRAIPFGSRGAVPADGRVAPPTPFLEGLPECCRTGVCVSARQSVVRISWAATITRLARAGRKRVDVRVVRN